MSASDVRAYYDDFSRNYDRGRDRGYHAMVDDIEAGAVIDLAAGRDVLEVGCGTGLVLERVARVARRAEGVDLSPGMLEHARLRGLSVREGDATAIP
ncbi:MAG: methyltransferase domain-containing protein, partial [Deltaproteobacteria bacterium]